MSTSTLRPPVKRAPRAVPSSWNPHLSAIRRLGAFSGTTTNEMRLTFFVPVPDQQGACIPLPEPRLGVAAPQRRLRQDAEGEERATVGDLGVGVDEGREVALTHRSQHDLVPVEHAWPLSFVPRIILLATGRPPTASSRLA
jgi:hypothetical protein